MPKMDLTCDSPEPQEEHLSKRQKTADFEEDFENVGADLFLWFDSEIVILTLTPRN